MLWFGWYLINAAAFKPVNAQEANPVATQIGFWIGLAIVPGTCFLLNALVIIGAIQMKKMKTYAMAMTAAIIAVIPCVSPLCLLGLPFGIWALVVLNNANVKTAFRS